jgi:hypothetical protein
MASTQCAKQGKRTVTEQIDFLPIMRLTIIFGFYIRSFVGIRILPWRFLDQSTRLFLYIVIFLAIQAFRRGEFRIFLVLANGLPDRGYQPGKRLECPFLVCADRLNQSGDFARLFPAAPVNPDNVTFHMAS